MVKKTIAALFAMAAFFVLFRAQVRAHPHCYILNSIHFVFNADGLDRLLIEWQYDEIFSAQIVDGCDMDGEPSLSEVEKDCIREQYFDELRAYDYFTSIRVNGRTIGTPVVLDPHIALVEGRMMVQFTVPLAVSAGDKLSRVQVDLYDPTYYCSMTFPEQLPVFLDNDSHLNTMVTIRENRDVSYYYSQVHPWEADLTFCRPPCDPGENEIVVGNDFVPGSAGEGGDTERLSFKARMWRVQSRLYGRISELAKSVREDSDGGALFLLLGAAFLYGLVHAAGPGHGKAFAASYVLGHKPSMRRALFFGNMIALLHGASAVALVTLIHTAVLAFSGASMDRVEFTTKAVSYGLISLMGLYMLISTMLGRSHQNRQKTDGSRLGGFGAMAVFIGLVPCPGVALILLFAMSLEMFQTGLLMILCQVLGMAVTISAVTILVTLGRRGMLRGAGRGEKIIRKMDFILEMFAGFALFFLGGVFLLGTVV